MTPLRVAYLLEDTAIAGGTRVVAAHGDALTDRGHEVTLVTRGGPLTWRGSRARWRHVQQFDELDPGDFDFIVGTFWTTLEAAHRIGGGKGIHFCQGYEGSFTAYQPMKEQIDTAYRLPLPKITVSPHLVEICRGFYDDATYIGQIVDDLFYQPHSSHAGTRTRVLLVGPAQADFKGIDVGYEAVRHARADGAELDLIRASQWPAADGELSALAAEFHVGLPSDAMARLIASCDVFLGPSRSAEGFGLPAAEALASGLPAVLSAIPSFLSWDEGHDYALFTPEGDAAAMGAALLRLLAEDALRSTLAERGRAVVEQFRAEVTGGRLERYFQR